MKIALVGGTHGNEPVGIEVLRLFSETSKTYRNSFECFLGNPRAFEQKKRYVDSDLNRAFGSYANPKGFEQNRAEELTQLIKGNFDLCIDLHTTTSNMGLCAILNNTHINTRKACVSLKQNFSDVTLIEENNLDEKCTHLNRLCPAGITIEVGPVANNVVSGLLVLKTHQLVEHILNFDFDQKIDGSEIEYFKQTQQIDFPEKQGWYLHPQLENNDFNLLESESPVFVNLSGETINWERPAVYPFFINEAAYLENRSAFLIADKKIGIETI